MNGLAEKAIGGEPTGLGRLRMSAHEKWDKYFDGLRPLFEREKTPSLHEIIDAVQ